MVKVYALSTCPWCKKAKKYLDDKGVEYQSIDVDKAPKEEKEAALKEIDQLSNDRSFPIIVVNDTVIKGFKPEEIEEALNNGA